RSLANTTGRAFAAARLRRIGVPLLAACLFVMPLIYLAWTWGWVRFGYASWEHLWHFHFGPAVQQNLHGFGHLWLLLSLLLFSLPAALCRPLVRRAANTTACRWSTPVVGALLVPICVFPPTAVTRFENAYLPVLGFFLYHLVFFAWGCV